MPDDKMIASMLVPAFCSPSTDVVTAGRVRLAFVAHTMFFHEAGQIAVQIDRLAASGLSDEETLVRLLCESYSRAIFESAFSMYFDQADPKADVHLMEAIASVYGEQLAGQVFATVKARGVVLR